MEDYRCPCGGRTFFCLPFSAQYVMSFFLAFLSWVLLFVLFRCLHFHPPSTVRQKWVRHELMGRFWYVILPQRSPLPMCHIENEKKDEGDSLVSHIHSLCSSSCPDVGIFLSSSLLPRIRMFNSHDVHAHSIQASPRHTGDLLRPISSLINAIGGMKKPHRQATVMCLFQLY